MGAYYRTGLTGGTGNDLDGIDTTGFADKLLAIVEDGANFYMYRFDSSSVASESSPDVIAPDTGTGRWILQTNATVNAATSEATANTLAKRDANGTFKVTTPTESAHVATLADVLAASGGVVAATPNTIPLRNTNGTFKVSAATDDSHPVRLSEHNATLNPKAISQAINMTATSSGSNGIQVANDDNINFGTGDFTLVWKGSLPDWITGSQIELIHKYATTTGRLTFGIHANGNVLLRPGEASLLSTVIPSLINGSVYELVASFQNGVGATFFVNGVQLGDFAPDTTVRNVNDAASSYVSGTAVNHCASTTQAVILYNRALSAADVAKLYETGSVDAADMWGSQTPVYESDFSAGVDGWTDTNTTLTGNVDSIAGIDDVLKVVAGNIHSCALKKTITEIKNGLNVELEWDQYHSGNTTAVGLIVYNDSASAWDAAAQISADGVWEHKKVQYTLTMDTDLVRIYFTIADGTITNITVGDTFYIKNFSIKCIGATAAYLPENIQPVPGQWLDASSNKLHAKMPIAGCTLIRPDNTFEIRWTLTWAGTTTTQYIGGVNESILPPNAYIDEIIGNVTGTTIEDITIGDGVDGDRFVTITSGLATGITSFALASRTTDGTSYKMTATPDAAFTGSISFTITGKILEA